MFKIIYKLYWIFLVIVNLPLILSEYFNKETGKEYGIGFTTKLILAFKMIRNNLRITSASNFIEHLMMATRIFNVPPSVEGCVIECGSYKGGSTSNLSLVCDICKRELEVFDSFQGLPEPSDADKVHVLMLAQEQHAYNKGAWRGGLEEVKANVSHFGAINQCNFNVGYFENTTPQFNKKSIFIFIDVDLRSSLETCMKYLWASLQDGCYLYTHEAPHIEIASLFFDIAWWKDNHKSNPPGLVGAGSGLGLIPYPGAYRSAIGYTIKNPTVLKFKVLPQTG